MTDLNEYLKQLTASLTELRGAVELLEARIEVLEQQSRFFN